MNRKVQLGLILLLALFPALFFGQPCIPDPNVGLGIHPEVPPAGCVGDPYNEVVTFVFPEDTTIGGITVPFDSFVVKAVNQVPDSLHWECDQMANGCTYIPNGGPARGCVRIFGTPATSNASTDSVEVIGAAWVTVFGFPTEIEDTIRIHVRVCPNNNCLCVTSRDEIAQILTGFQVFPHPLQENSQIRFRLMNSRSVSMQFSDLFGRTLLSQELGNLPAGEHSYDLPNDLLQWEPGIYFLHLETDEGRLTQKLVITNQ